MPLALAAMETVDAEKVSKKCTEMEGITKPSKTIMDFFKTPEKAVLSKQKSLLQYFTKNDVAKDSKLDISTEKENSVSLDDNGPVKQKNSLSNGAVTAVEKLSSKKKDDLSQKVKRKQKETKKKQPAKNVIESKCQTNCVSKEECVHKDTEDSVVLISDTSNLEEETLTETSEQKKDKLPQYCDESIAVTDEKTEIIEQSGLKRKEKIEAPHHEMNHKSSIKPEEDFVSNKQANSLEKADSDKKDLLGQDNTVSIESDHSKMLKKKTLKCKEMMNLLKETLGSDAKEKKKSKHKHKDKLKNTEETEHGMKYKDNKDHLSDIINEKRKGKKSVKFTEHIQSDIETHNRIKEKDAELKGSHHVDVSINNDIASVESKLVDRNVNDISASKTGEKVPEGKNSIAGTETDAKNLVNDQGSINEKCNREKRKMTEKIKNAEDETKQQTKRLKEKCEKVCPKESNALEVCDEINEDKDSEVKSISYEDFLRNLRKEESVPISEEEESSGIKANEIKEMSYLEFLNSCEDKDSAGRQSNMSLDKRKIGKELPSTFEENSETSMETNLPLAASSGSNCTDKSCTTKEGEKQSKAETKSESTMESKPGIAKFFTMVTSTPNRPEKDIQKCQQKVASPKSAGKNSRKIKKSKMLDDKLRNESCDDDVSRNQNRNLPETKNKLENNTMKEPETNAVESDVIEVIEGMETTEEKDEESQRKKSEFLNSKSSVCSGKTTQAVLSFGISGLTMTKSNNIDKNAGNKECSDVDNANKTPLKNKTKKETKLISNKDKEKQNLADDSHVFETPKNTRKGKKTKMNSSVVLQQSESDETCEDSQTDESGYENRRRSLRNRYKVAKFEMDEENRTPIKLKLKRDEKSSSSFDEIDGLSTKAKKIKLTSKRSKAKALIDKAKKHKKKPKSKPEKEGKENRSKGDKKLKEKAKKSSDNESDEVVVEHRRSSRLVGKTMPSMEEVSLENIVILSDDEEEYDGFKKKRKKMKKAEKIIKNKDEVLEIPVAKNSPKRKKAASPKKKIASPKKTASPKKVASPKKPVGKLAPIFMGKSTKSTEEKKPPLDPELAKQRMQFLMSGVPEELRKQSAKTVAAAIATDYPPIPTVSHALQKPDANIVQEGLIGRVDVWQLKKVELNYRRFNDPFYLEPVSRFTGDLINRQMVNVDLSLIKNFTSHPIIESAIEEACVGEVSCYNPSFPVNKIFSALKKLKQAAEQLQETDKTEVQSAEPEVITVVDEEPEKKKRGRKSRLKLQKEEKVEVTQTTEDTPQAEEKKLVKSLLWTDKYQPSSSTEVIGNSGPVKKMKNWLSEWKHVLDREAKKARKLLMKKNKGKLLKTEDADDQWDDDSDFDMDSDDSDIEDTLCNTMLITGPHGCGKTTAVYALAQELGFKVHEVNASSSRNGKRILSQLQEATQSHQVSRQGCGTPIKNLGTAGPSTPKPAKMPTAFTNLFNKKKETPAETVINVDEKKSKKRKRETAEREESPKKKRSKRNENKDSKPKTLKPTFLDIDESSNGLVQGLNLSSTTLILFDEVDLVFDDDKGFHSAIQTFMATTKIPIIMTTTSPRFTAHFDGRYETLTFKHPPVTSLCSYVQLICLLEGLRVNPAMLSELLQLFRCDVRRSLLSLQFVLESGGSLSQNVRSVAKPSMVETKQALPIVEETIESSQDSQGYSKPGFNPTFGDNDDDDFVMLKPRTNRQRRLIEDDNSNSVDAFAQMFHQKQTELVPTSKQDEDAKLYPCVHGLSVGSLVGLTLSQVENVHDIFLRNLKMPTITNLLEICNICEIYRTFCPNLMSNNLPLLLPLVTKVTDHVISAEKDNVSEPKAKKRKRIQTDLYDSEASNDASDITDVMDAVDDKPEGETKSVEKTISNSAENRCSVKTLSALSRFYDTVGMLDTMETQESLKVKNSLRTTCGRRVYGSVRPGLDDRLPDFHTACDLDCDVSKCYCTEVEVRSVSRLYQEIDRVQGEVEQLCRDNPAYSEDYVLPVLRGNEKFSLVERNQPSQKSGERRGEENVAQNLPLIVHNHHRSLQLDYLPTLREISRTEQLRQTSNTKRRFHHYFDQITLPLKDTTLNILSSTFT